MQGERPLALVRIQIGVARAHGKAVELADDWADHNLYRKIQVAHHAADDRGLGGILLPEEGYIGLDDVEEFGDHSGHAAKVAGTRASVEPFAQAFDDDPGCFALGIHLFSRGREQNGNTLFFQKLAVAFVRPGILGEVFVRAELRRVDEERHSYGVTPGLGRTYQRKMTFMQSAHGGYESEALAVCSGQATESVGFSDIGEDLHGLALRSRRFVSPNLQIF